MRYFTVNSHGRLSRARFEKAPADVSTLKFDFALFGDNADVDAHTVKAENGLTVDSSSATGSQVETVISGGSDGQCYDLTVKATIGTTVKEATVQVKVKDYTFSETDGYGS